MRTCHRIIESMAKFQECAKFSVRVSYRSVFEPIRYDFRYVIAFHIVSENATNTISAGTFHDRYEMLSQQCHNGDTCWETLQKDQATVKANLHVHPILINRYEIAFYIVSVEPKNFGFHRLIKKYQFEFVFYVSGPRTRTRYRFLLLSQG